MYPNLRFVFLLVISQIYCVALTAQDTTDTSGGWSDRNQTEISYARLWSKVKGLENSGLYRLAWKKCGEILQTSIDEKNDAQALKAAIYELRLARYVEEEDYGFALFRLDSMVRIMPSPAREIFHSILAETYWSYFSQNQWTLMQRSYVEDVDLTDFRTWDLRRLAMQIKYHYYMSLDKPEISQKMGLDAFKEIIYYDVDGVAFRPSIYDFLAHRALDFAKYNTVDVGPGESTFTLKDEKYFGSNLAFADLDIQTTDTFNTQYFSLLIFQNLIQFHNRIDNRHALFNLEMERLDYLRAYSPHPKREDIYFRSIENLAWSSGYEDYAAEAWASYARFLVNRANTTSQAVDSTYFDDLHAAKLVCDRVHEHLSGTYGDDHCTEIKNQINTHELAVRTIQAVPSNSQTTAMVDFRNVDTVWMKILKYDAEDYAAKSAKYAKSNKGYALPLDVYLRKKKAEHYKSVPLLNPGDHRNHSVELLVPELEPGYYYLIVGSHPEFKKEPHGFAYTGFHVTDLTYQHRSNGNKLEIAVSHRKTGKPVEGATVRLYSNEYDYRTGQYAKHNYASAVSDKDGIASINNTSTGYYFSYYVTVEKGDDVFDANDYVYLPYPDQQHTDIVTSFYTDRKIYRPGQTVHFKGIAIRQQGDQRSLATNWSTTVYLHDPNSQEVENMSVRTNEFGSFAGSFKIPESVRTGSFRINNYYGSAYFNVEEYKRPRFTAELEPVEEQFSVHDLVTVSGSATGLAGNKIDGATVAYKISRYGAYSKPFPSTYSYNSWSSSYSYYYYDNVELASGTTTSDENGEFKINFVALPDPKADPYQLPHFTYTITADITDAAGETQSCTGSVVVGYEGITLSNNIPQNVDCNDSLILWVRSNNLNWKETPSKGNFTVQKMLTPEEVIFDRPLGKPDIERWSEAEYHELFPGRNYDDEKNYANWKRGKVIINQAFDTGIKDSFDIVPGTFSPGVYRYFAKAKDQNGIEIENEFYFNVYEMDSKEIPSNDIFWCSSNYEIYQPGDTLEIAFGTASDELVVRLESEVRDRIDYSSVITLNNEQNVVRLPIEEKHIGNFTIHLNGVKENQHFSHYLSIQVPRENKELDVKFSSFRDKLMPGEKETWTVTVKNKKGEKETAELMAALYDASLDELYSPNSFYLYVWQNYYGRSAWSAIQGTAATYSSTAHGDWNEYFYASTHSYPYMIGGGSYYSGDSYGWRDGFYKESMTGDGWEESSEEYNSPMADAISTVAGFNTYQLDATDSNGATSWDFDDGVATGSSEVTRSVTKESAVVADPENLRNVVRGGDWKVAGQLGEKNSEYDSRLNAVQARSDFSETAFFYPQLKTDENGSVEISFTMPESVTKWRFLGMAHTKDLKVGYLSEEMITQKPVMVMPNAPRFLREGDKISLTAKIANMSDKLQSGQLRLELIDPESGKKIGKKFSLTGADQKFEIKAGQSKAFAWTVTVPSECDVVKYRIVGVTDEFSDGEENVLPVLSNRMLVTESLPMPMRGEQSREFNFERLLKSAGNKSIRNHRFTLQFTSNPAWYALQATPYMMEYPWECLEQTFTRYYSNSIAAHIMDQNPKVREMIGRWKNESPDAFLSKLRQNPELKAVILEETPWVLDAQSEEETKKNLSVLLNAERMANELNRALTKVQEAQVYSGGWPWFKGGEESPYITRHIVCSMGHLDKMGVKNIRYDYASWSMLIRAIQFMDKEIYRDYRYAKKYDPLYWKHNHIGYDQVHYLYARSFFPDIPMNAAVSKAVGYYKRQARKYWLSFNNYAQGMIAISAHRMEMPLLANQITASLKDRAIQSEEFGMYWKENTMGYYWYEAPVETQALMIEMFNEVSDDQAVVDELKIWLLKQKQTESWSTTRQTSEAVYALLITGSDLLASDELVEISLGDRKIEYVSTPDTLDPFKVKAEPGTGYFSTHWNGDAVTAALGKISVTKKDKGIAWGAAYWQYFEDLDKITIAETGLKLSKQLFLVKNTPDGEKITKVSDATALKVGDRVRSRIELRSDRNLEFVHMKDMRAAGFEPLNVISSYRWQDGLGYYQATKDASTNFFFDYIPKGTYVFEYDLRVQHRGDFSHGIATIQCMYAPEFSAHSNGIRVRVN